MKKAVLIPIAAVMLAGASAAQAHPVVTDIIETIWRGKYDRVEKQIIAEGKVFDVVRTPLPDGTLYMEYKRPGGVLTWEKATVHLQTDGLQRGLPYKIVDDDGETTSVSFTMDDSGRIIRVHFMNSLSKGRSPIDITPVRTRCSFGKDAGCYRLDNELAKSVVMHFSRGSDGTLLGGTVATAWFALGHEMLTSLQKIAIERPSADRSILKFEAPEQPWAYGIAGHELREDADGKQLLRVCYTFVNGECNTTRD